MEISELLKKAMDRFEIKGKDLAEFMSVTPNYLSEIRNGKKWLSEENLMLLLKGMDQIKPGSRTYFCELLAGVELSPRKEKESLLEIINEASEEEISQALVLIAKRIKKSHKFNEGHETTNIYIGFDKSVA